MNLEIVPISIREARAFVDQHHRHHKAPSGGKFAIGISKDGSIIGVAIVGRPIARLLDDNWTAEVTRLCTDGTTNACSKLYAACWRAARAMGYRKLITYTLASESGASVVAAGWRCVGEIRGHTWNSKGRPRVDLYPLQNKIRWEIAA